MRPASCSSLPVLDSVGEEDEKEEEKEEGEVIDESTKIEKKRKVSDGKRDSFLQIPKMNICDPEEVVTPTIRVGDEKSTTPYNLRKAITPPDRLNYTSYMCFSAIMGEPINYEEAITSPDSKHWKEALNEEFQSLESNGTWKLVPRPQHRNVISCKWVFRLKSSPGDERKRYKARLLIRGFSQQPEIDFEETFAPVVRFDTVRAVLAVAAVRDLEILQFVVKTAFLNGELHEEIYMEPPQGYKTMESDFVCRLKKSLYGLKQAPRVWNIKFTNFLKDNQFVQSDADDCLFVREVDNELTYLVLYVDDGLLLSRKKETVEAVMELSGETFWDDERNWSILCWLGN